ncbi:unnamed protein product [Caenorhabditis brenneri]
MSHRFFDRSPNRPPFNHSALPLPTTEEFQHQHGNRDQAVRHNRQQQHRRERSPPRDPRLGRNGNQPSFAAARGQERAPGHQQAQTPPLHQDLLHALGQHLAHSQVVGNRPSHQQGHGQQQAFPQAVGYQQPPPQASNQAPPQVPAYHQPPPPTPAYQQAPPQAHTHQPAPSQVTAYRQALRQQAIEQHQLARQQMAAQLARDEGVDGRQSSIGRGSQSPHHHSAQVADQSRQREEQMRREQSRERSTPRDPRAVQPQNPCGQEQAHPPAHCQQEHERRHQERRQQELRERSLSRDSRPVQNPLLQGAARKQEQAQYHHQASPSVPQHSQAQVLAQPMFEEQEHRQHPARNDDEDDIRRHQYRPVQIKQEPDDELTIIAEFRGDGVEAARMEKKAQIFRKEQYKKEKP